MTLVVATTFEEGLACGGATSFAASCDDAEPFFAAAAAAFNAARGAVEEEIVFLECRDLRIFCINSAVSV